MNLEIRTALGTTNSGVGIDFSGMAPCCAVSLAQECSTPALRLATPTFSMCHVMRKTALTPFRRDGHAALRLRAQIVHIQKYFLLTKQSISDCLVYLENDTDYS